MNSFEKKLSEKIARELPDLASYTPGMILDVHVRGRRKGTVYAGKTYDIYDLASLTKIIFTASASMRYFSLNPRALKQPVKHKLEWWHAQTTPADLLTHTAGLDWWMPYYRKLKGPLVPQRRWDQLKKLLARRTPGRKGKAVYSDLDLWMMGAFLEEATGNSLEELWVETASALKLKGIFFQPGNKPRYARSRYAPTEDCPWRGKVLRGEVHDENTWALGGVAPHSGLFGPVEAVSDWGLKLRAAVLKDAGGFGSPEMARRFTRRQIPPSRGDWGYGFMKPTRGCASCGRYFSAQSFGHTGFTGTSLWMDTIHDVLVVILSNRVHPTRENNSFVGLRGRLHDWIFELCFKG